jgi:hypothetical protein
MHLKGYINFLELLSLMLRSPIYQKIFKNLNLKIKIDRNIIFPVVLYGCETWSLTLSAQGRLRVFENRMLRKIFGPKKEGVTTEWRKLRN